MLAERHALVLIRGVLLGRASMSGEGVVSNRFYGDIGFDWQRRRAFFQSKGFLDQ